MMFLNLRHEDHSTWHSCLWGNLNDELNIKEIKIAKCGTNVAHEAFIEAKRR
jgi:hypothetical protein